MLLSFLRFLTQRLHGAAHHRYSHYVVEVLGLVLAVWLGFAVHRHYTPQVTYVKTNEHTTTVTVDKPVLSEKIITKILTDPKDKAAITALLAENSALKLRVTSLTNTVATLDSRGSGLMVTQPVDGQPSANYHFEDYRLKFDTDLTTANYALSQKFVVLTTTGRDKDGKPTTLVSVYEQGPNGERLAVPAQTTAIFADANANRWFMHPTVQAGFAGSRDLGGTNVTGGIAGMQWLKHGRSNATQDIRWAVATPVLFFGQGLQEVGVLPISFNVGTIRKQPFTNIWLSPYLGVNIAGLTRLGFAVSATF